jgi:hypothetical protein
MNAQRRAMLGAFLTVTLCPSAMSNPSMKLTWDDLFSQDPALDFSRIFSCWPKLGVGRARPVGMSAIGTCFFERPEGTVHALNPIRGEIYQVAQSSEEFGKNMNAREWQEENLNSVLVAEILARGLTRSGTQAFGFAPHPRFGGGLTAQRAMVLDATVWHSISGQAFE